MTTLCSICQSSLSGKQTKFCSRKCRNQDVNYKWKDYEAQKKRGLKRKLALIKLKGGKCSHCSYKRNIAALSFHHRTPKSKKFGIDIRQCSNRAWSVLLKEAKKCELLCLNCHAEIEHPA